MSNMIHATYITSGVTDGWVGRSASRPRGKLNVQTGPPLAILLIF